MCEPRGPRDYQAGDCVNPKDQEGDCCVNPEDQEITRRMIVAESLLVKMVAEPTQPVLSAGRPFQESCEGDVSR